MSRRFCFFFPPYSACETRLVGQPVPLLQKVQPQHPLQPNRRPTAFALQVRRAQSSDKLRLRVDLLHLGQKFVPTRLLLLTGSLRVRKAPVWPAGTTAAKSTAAASAPAQSAADRVRP